MDTSDRDGSGEHRSPLEIETDLAEAGMDAVFTILPGAQVRCSTCDHVTAGADLTAEESHRTEGASDPSDMTIVVGIACPNCGARGSLTLGYGPDADPDAADLVVALPRGPRRQAPPS